MFVACVGVCLRACLRLFVLVCISSLRLRSCRLFVMLCVRRFVCGLYVFFVRGFVCV